MKTISSSEFRKTYASLGEHVAVTANGHIIGRWAPGAAEYIFPSLSERQFVTPRTPEDRSGFASNTRPFTPVPKPKRK